MCNIIKRARASGLDFPPSPRDAQKEECLLYHIEGLCYARYGRRGDYFPYPAGGDRAMHEWSNKAIPGRKDNGGGGK